MRRPGPPPPRRQPERRPTPTIDRVRRITDQIDDALAELAEPETTTAKESE